MEHLYHSGQDPQESSGSNLTGIPTQMKLDFEQHSGLSFDDVRVHYGSEKPERVQALAYTQGTDVYLGPGQERCLPHELGHIIQQKSRAIPVTQQWNGLPFNADPAMEAQADAFASGALRPSSSLIEDFRNMFAPIQAMRITQVPLSDDEEDEDGFVTIDLASPAQIAKKGKAEPADPSVQICTISDFYKQFLEERLGTKSINQAKGIFRDFLQYAFSDPTAADKGIPFEELVSQFLKYYASTKGTNFDIVDSIYQVEILPHMAKYFTYGLKSQFRRYCVASQIREENFCPSVDGFIDFLASRVRATVGNRRQGGKLLREFSVMSMSRPQWTAEIKEKLEKKMAAGISDANIRHVIRNFDLKKALDIYYKQTGLEGLQAMAAALEISKPNNLGSIVDMLARKIYNKLYLNPSNLWIGDGPVNQIIGFLATPLEDYGKAISAGECAYSEKSLEQIIDSSLLNLRDIEQNRGAINGLKAVILSILTDCSTDEEYGEYLQDIGLNLGFDLIDDATDESERCKRQGMLIDVNTQLKKYIDSEGDGDLVEIFVNFLREF